MAASILTPQVSLSTAISFRGAMLLSFVYGRLHNVRIGHKLPSGRQIHEGNNLWQCDHKREEGVVELRCCENYSLGLQAIQDIDNIERTMGSAILKCEACKHNLKQHQEMRQNLGMQLRSKGQSMPEGLLQEQIQQEERMKAEVKAWEDQIKELKAERKGLLKVVDSVSTRYWRYPDTELPDFEIMGEVEYEVVRGNPNFKIDS